MEFREIDRRFQCGRRASHAGQSPVRCRDLRQTQHPNHGNHTIISVMPPPMGALEDTRYPLSPTDRIRPYTDGGGRGSGRINLFSTFLSETQSS
jgi:hypothetical protein